MTMARSLAASLVFVALATTASAQEFHQDARLGFKIRPPKDFTKVPLKPDEEWIAVRWISDKAFYQTDKTDGWTVDHKPEMNVIAFSHEMVNDKVDVKKEGTAGSESTTVIIKNPYKDYRDFLKRTYNEGGFYVSAEDKADVEGVAADTLEIKVERGLRGGPRKIVTWVFKGDDIDFAVQYEMFESAWPKLKPDVLSSLRSFRRIAKDTAALKSDTSAFENKIKEGRLDELSPAQRAARRRDLEKQNEEKCTKGLPEEWTAKRYGRVYMLSHVDDKTTAKFAADATAVLDYLDANLAFIGPAEYVREPVIRICKDYDEYHVYSKGSAYSWGDEIVTYRNTGFTSMTKGVTADCAEHWIHERNNDLYNAMPEWLQYGLREAFGNSRAKNGKLEFYNDSWERVDVAENIRAGKFSTLKDLMHLGREKVFSDRNKTAECAAATRFLLTGPKKAKDAFRAYLDALAPIVKQLREERDKVLTADPTKKPKTEEEEDAQFKEARTKLREADQKVLDDTFTRAFGTMNDADWKLLEIAYQKSLG